MHLATFVRIGIDRYPTDAADNAELAIYVVSAGKCESNLLSDFAFWSGVHVPQSATAGPSEERFDKYVTSESQQRISDQILSGLDHLFTGDGEDLGCLQV